MFSQEMVLSGVTKSEASELNQDFLRSDGWRKIVVQVESALCREDRSRQALDQLQQLAAEQGASTQFLLKSVIRETIRLTLECFGDATDMLKRCEASLSPTPAVAEVQAEAKLKPVALVLTPEQKEAQEDDAVFTAMARVLQPAKPDKSLLERLRPAATPKLSPEILAQQTIAAKEASLLALCHEFRQHRSRQSLSLKQIHASTFISLHHLQSLEENKLDRLPEEVYLRGFLRRLEKCFNLADGQLSRHLPAAPTIERWRSLPERESNLTSSTAPARRSMTDPRSSVSAGLASNNPNYVYIAYAALMAGGVCWIAQQGTPKPNLSPLQIDTPASGPQNAPQRTSNKQVQQTQAQLSQNIAQPEAFS
jgi:cytoskeleton protein RodZ